ncbi:MAG TPA: hypothetical protein VG605_15995 [Puia sp.]|jgi:hypothetical protein|nr:hypothetical protein [Puia sp.]
MDLENIQEGELAEKINALIQNDFGALVQLLYRIDVSEDKLRRMLADNSGEDAGRLIARLIIERQRQKIENRRKYRRDDDIDTGVERW